MEQTRQPTRQLPPPASLPMPRRRSWFAPLFGGVAEVLARLAEVCLHPLIVLPLFFGVLGTTNLSIGGAVAIVLAAGSLGMALAAPFQVDRWPNLRLYTLLAA